MRVDKFVKAKLFLEKAKESEAIKEFAQFLVDKSENGVISVADLP